MKLKDDKNFYIIDKINQAVKSNPNEIIEHCENHYQKQIQDTVTSMCNRHVIMLAGPSASGKTTTAGKLRDEFIRIGRSSVVISMDDFYKDRKRLPIIDGKINAEVIEALEIDMIKAAIMSLLKVGETALPQYDFISGVRKDEAKLIEIDQNGVMIIEGIHALDEQMRNSLPQDEILNTYVSPHSGFVYDDNVELTKRQTRCLRRLIRDSWSRGSTAENTLTMWPTVCQGEDLYIRPSAQYADCRIDSTFGYEPCILKNRAVNLLSEVSKQSENYLAARSLLKKLQYFIELDERVLPENSLLHEFID